MVLQRLQQIEKETESVIQKGFKEHGKNFDCRG